MSKAKSVNQKIGNLNLFDLFQKDKRLNYMKSALGLVVMNLEKSFCKFNQTPLVGSFGDVYYSNET